MLSRPLVRMAVLAAVAGLSACSQPHDPAKLWTGRAPAVQAVGMRPAAAPQPAVAGDTRSVGSFDSAASGPLVVGTLVAR
jgi:hypothetical protein